MDFIKIFERTFINLFANHGTLSMFLGSLSPAEIYLFLNTLLNYLSSLVWITNLLIPKYLENGTMPACPLGDKQDWSK